jgi:hypothetical protein
LRAGLDVEHATDILWTLNHPEVWLLLSTRRGWSGAEFEHWFAAACCRELLADGDGDGAGAQAADTTGERTDGRARRRR